MDDKNRIVNLLKETRQERGVTQQQMAKLLDMSQSRYSDLEQSKGTLTAEQFLLFIRHFNLSLEPFSRREGQKPEQLLKLALSKWGAKQLVGHEEGLVHTNLYSLYASIVEVLVGFPRRDLICALGPVIITNRNMINFDSLGMRLYDIGLDGRLWWLVEAIIWAVRDRLKWFIPREIKDMYQEAEEILGMKSKAANAFFSLRKAYPTDVLDEEIKTVRVMEKVRAERDGLSSKWRIITRIRQEDFSEVLKKWEECQ